MRAAPATERLIVGAGTAAIAFEVQRTSRNVLKIEVDPAGRITVYAPDHAATDQILARVNRKANWIQRRLEEVSDRGPASPIRHFVSGESHLLLGIAYRLAVEPGSEAYAQIVGRRLVVTAREPDDSGHVRRILESFYRLKGREVFPERLTLMLPPFARRGLRRPKLVIRRLRKRWGSYTPQGRVVLNADLIRATPDLIDYVVCHELAHAFHADHSHEWRELMRTVMPDWEQRKVLLEKKLR